MTLDRLLSRRANRIDQQRRSSPDSWWLRRRPTFLGRVYAIVRTIIFTLLVASALSFGAVASSSATPSPSASPGASDPLPTISCPTTGLTIVNDVPSAPEQSTEVTFKDLLVPIGAVGATLGGAVIGFVGAQRGARSAELRSREEIDAERRMKVLEREFDALDAFRATASKTFESLQKVNSISDSEWDVEGLRLRENLRLDLARLLGESFRWRSEVGDEVQAFIEPANESVLAATKSDAQTELSRSGAAYEALMWKIETVRRDRQERLVA